MSITLDGTQTCYTAHTLDILHAQTWSNIGSTRHRVYLCRIVNGSIYIVGTKR